VANGKLIDMTALDASKASILTKVKIKNVKTGAIVEYTLVAEEEADLKLNRLSVKSPIGKGLLGKKIGEKAEVVVPAGKIEFEIIDIVIDAF